MGTVFDWMLRLQWLKWLPMTWCQDSGTQGKELRPPQGRTWVTKEKALEPARGDGTLENLTKLFEPQFSYA